MERLLHETEKPAGATAGSPEICPLLLLPSSEGRASIPHAETEVENIDVDPILPRGTELHIRRFCAMAATAGIELDMETVRLYVRRGVKLSQGLVTEMVNRKRRYEALPEEVLEDHIPRKALSAAAKKTLKLADRVALSVRKLADDLGTEREALAIANLDSIKEQIDGLIALREHNAGAEGTEVADG